MKFSTCIILTVLLLVSLPGMAQPEALEFESRGQGYRVVSLADGLESPWSIGFLPDRRTMLVTEQAGRLRLFRDGELSSQVVWESPLNSDEENVQVMSLVIHPQFDQNQWVYVAHEKVSDEGSTLAISRGRLEDDVLIDVEEIFVADAWEEAGNMGGRMLFAPDNTLFVTVGDRDFLCCTGTDDDSLRMKAQDLGSHVGKTLRINDDGSVPADNPFVGQVGVLPEIYTYGHRNGYGLAYHPETGELWQAEIGPLGGDEINILQAGQNYGWPLVSTGRNYTGTLVSDQPWYREGMVMPRMFWVPSISPSSIMFYTGERFPDWKNNLFVGGLTKHILERISFGNTSQDERRDPLLEEFDLRVRDVAQGPDGLLYVATQLGVGGQGSILRLEPIE